MTNKFDQKTHPPPSSHTPAPTPFNPTLLNTPSLHQNLKYCKLRIHSSGYRTLLTPKRPQNIQTLPPPHPPTPPPLSFELCECVTFDPGQSVRSELGLIDSRTERNRFVQDIQRDIRVWERVRRERAEGKPCGAYPEKGSVFNRRREGGGGAERVWKGAERDLRANFPRSGQPHIDPTPPRAALPLPLPLPPTLHPLPACTSSSHRIAVPRDTGGPESDDSDDRDDEDQQRPGR